MAEKKKFWYLLLTLFNTPSVFPFKTCLKTGIMRRMPDFKSKAAILTKIWFSQVQFQIALLLIKFDFRWFRVYFITLKSFEVLQIG